MKQRDRDLVSASGLFDNDWYLAAYPDVAALAVEPIEHFLMLGWLLGRNPSPAFDTKWYLATNPDVATSGINPLVHYLQHGCQEGRLPRPNGVLALEGKLWGGFSEAARAALEALYMAGSVGAQERSLAALALAQWYVFQKDWRQAW